MSEQNNIEKHKDKSYPLLPYSQLVFDMLRDNPDVYYTVELRLKIKTTTSADTECLINAINTAFKNHPAFSIQIDNNGLQHFIPKDDVLHGQYHSIDIRKEKDHIYLNIKINRILGDGISNIILMENLYRAYKGLTPRTDFYREYLEQREQCKLSARYKQNKQWLETEFGDISYPLHPKTDLSVPMTMEGVFICNFSNMQKKLKRIAKERLVSLNAFFSLCAALAIMDYNDTDEAALTWAYDGRETGDEQYIYGSLHRDIPMKIRRNRSTTREELFQQIRLQMREGIKLSSYPYTLLAPQNEKWNYAVNVLQQPVLTQMLQEMPFEVEIIESGEHTNLAYSLLDIEIYETEKLTILYRYSSTHYKEESMRKFADLVRKNAEWLL